MSDCQLLSELPESIEVDGARGGNGEQAKASSGENILGICFSFIFVLPSIPTAACRSTGQCLGCIHSPLIARGKRGGGFESDTTRLEWLP